jgi:hypothetical protein
MQFAGAVLQGAHPPFDSDQKEGHVNQIQLDIQRHANAIVETANLRLAKSVTTAVRRKCFVSYHTADADEIIAFLDDFGEIFIPRTIGVTDEDDFIDSDDTNLIMNKIRTKYLTDSTVTIVLIGKCTWARRYVDWEVYSSLRDDPVNTRNGLMAVTLPSTSSSSKTLPDRVSDNVTGPDGTAGYARWWKYPSSQDALRSCIEIAFGVRESVVPVNSRARKVRSSPCT